MTGIGVGKLISAPKLAATPLGAMGAVSGGLARIQGLIPLELDNWPPPTPALRAALPAGLHRVRMLVEFTALEPDGIRFAAADFSVHDVASFESAVQWTDTADMVIKRGDSLQATLVFEIPDKSIELVLVGPEPLRLGLGSDHHS